MEPLKIHIFSKHLQFLIYKDMAEAAAEMGFDGIDLTVRPNGHVLPERVRVNRTHLVWSGEASPALQRLLALLLVPDAGPVQRSKAAAKASRTVQPGRA